MSYILMLIIHVDEYDTNIWVESMMTNVDIEIHHDGHMNKI